VCFHAQRECVCVSAHAQIWKKAENSALWPFFCSDLEKVGELGALAFFLSCAAQQLSAPETRVKEARTHAQTHTHTHNTTHPRTTQLKKKRKSVYTQECVERAALEGRTVRDLGAGDAAGRVCAHTHVPYYHDYYV